MRVGVVTKNENSWCSARVIEAFRRRGVEPFIFSLPQVLVRVGFKPEVEVEGFDLEKLDAILVRPIGPGSLDEIIFRIDLLHHINSLGVPVVNSPKAIERAADKFFTLTLLAKAGIPVPKTVVTENVRWGLKEFEGLGGDVVMKPIFGSRGMGITRSSDRDVLGRLARLVHYNHFILYLQKYVDHGNRDIRSFVVGGRVVASMYRVSEGWKTNVSQGAKAVPFKAEKEIEDLALKAAEAIGCEIAGVDLMEGNFGLIVHEINSQPGFRGLQTSSGIDIAGEMASYVMERTRR